MKIELNNIAIFSYKVIEVRDDTKISVISDLSATGKTTLAKVFRSFFIGDADPNLLRHSASEGSARLELGGKTYTLAISGNKVRVDKLVKWEPSDYLVFTEGTPIYTVYISPEKIDLEKLVATFIREPPELKELENELMKLRRENTDYDQMIKTYEENIKTYERRLEEINKELGEVESKLSKWRDVENIKVVIKKKDLENELNRIREQKASYEDEIKQKMLVLQNTGKYESLKQKRKELQNQLEDFEVRKKLLTKVKEGLTLLKDGLNKLDDVTDLLYELKIPLFGQMIDPQTISTYLQDCLYGIEVVTKELEEIDKETMKIREEMSTINSSITKYIEAAERYEILKSEINKLREKEEKLRSELAQLSNTVNELVKSLGESEEDLIRKFSELKDFNELMSKKKNLLNEKEKITTYIQSFKDAIERAKKEQEESETNKELYENIKKKYTALKSALQEREKKFKETFREAFIVAVKEMNIPDFNFNTLKPLRPPHTYSQSERFYIASAYQYAVVKSLIEIGYEVPLVVIDVISPLDNKYFKTITELFKRLTTKTIILRTSDIPQIQYE